MHPFRHPVFLLSAALFVLHQLTQKGLGIPIAPADSYLDPLLCAPLLLSGVLAERRVLLKRGPDYVLPAVETVGAVALLAFISEGLFPRWSDQFTADPADVAAYALGGLLFHFLLNRPKTRN